MKGIWLIYVVLPILIFLTWQQARAMSLRDQLVMVKNELTNKRGRLAQVKAREYITIKRIKDNEEGVEKATQRVKMSEKQIQNLQAGIKVNHKIITLVVSAKQQREKQRDDRLVELYKQLLSQDQLADAPFTSGLAPISAVCFKSAIEQDRSVISGQTSRLSSLEAEKFLLQKDKQQKISDRNAGIIEKKRLEYETSKQKNELASVKQEQEKVAAEIREYEARQKRLTSLLARLSRPTNKQAKISSRNNRRAGNPAPIYDTGSQMPDFKRFNLPVNGEITHRFGVYRHPVYGTSTFSSGLTIASQPGAAVRTIADGTVIYAGALKGFGNIIIVDHGQQIFSVYGRCGQIMKRVGTKVERGESIASVAAADLEGASLYFELRYRGKAVNPARFIG